MEIAKKTVGVDDITLILLEYFHDQRALQKTSLRVDFQTVYPLQLHFFTENYLPWFWI